MVERHAGVVRSGGKLSDGCNLPGESVNGRVAGGMILGAGSTSRSVPNGVHIWKQKRSKRVIHAEAETVRNG